MGLKMFRAGGVRQIFGGVKWSERLAACLGEVVLLIGLNCSEAIQGDLVVSVGDCLMGGCNAGWPWVYSQELYVGRGLGRVSLSVKCHGLGCGCLWEVVGWADSLCKRGKDLVASVEAQAGGAPLRYTFCELMLRLTAAWKNSGELHEACQERLRDNLRLMESEPAELTALFHELSVRLLSIHSDSDSIAITFNTAEELGKFTNYYSLGLVSECLKIALLSDAVWLMDPCEDQVTVQIDMNDESMRKMHLSLLLQEGRFHVRAWKSSAKASGEELALAEGEVLLVERAQGTGAWWTGRAVSSTKQGLIPRSAVEPLQHFHQWFLKSNSISDCLKHKSSLSENGKIGMGSCVATTDYKAECGDELSFKQGDHIEVEGLFIPGLHWFMGKVTSTERVGFVRMSCIRPDQITDTKGAFLHRSERFHRSGLDECTARHCYEFLSRLTGTDISTVYRIYRESHSDVETDLNKPDPVVKSMRSCSQDTKESFEFETILKLGLNDHVLENTFPHEKFKDANVAEEPQLWFSVELTKCGDDSDNENWSTNSESLIQFLLFLNTPEYRREFAVLYREDSPFLYSLLRGHTDDTELVRFLELAREMAKKGGMQWAQSRACFLLGRACSRQGKFSQARVYYEESLSMTDGDFPDMFLMAALYTNLTSMYLKVMNKEKATAMMEKTAILLVCLPGKCTGSSSAQDILKHLLSKVIFQNDLRLEGRICFLIAESLLNLNRADEALPYIERLQDLTNHFQQLSNKHTSSYYFLLNRLYATSFLRLSFGSMMRACDCDQMTITECIRCVELIVKSEGTIKNRQARRTTMSPLCAPFLYKALQKPLEEEHKYLHNSVHNYAHLSLAELYLQQHQVNDAVCHLNKVNAVRVVSSAGEAAAAFLLKLAWMYIRVDCLPVATQILENPELGSHSAGVIHNLLGIVHARHHNIPKAATHFQSALALAESCGEETNVAICYGNLGFLAVNAKAHLFAEICFLKAVHKYFAASNRDHEEWFNHVLVKLGQNFYTRGNPSEGLQCYEIALLIALKENDVRGQMHVTALLCQHYSSQKNDLQCIIYYEHQLNLARSSRDKRLEGDMLQILSQIYHGLGKYRDYRKAVKYVKRSLAIFIDLREMERTAEAWLLAGTIYSKLGQNEIVDLHLQMAVEVALTLGQVECALHVYEAAGDVFFNSKREPEKAIVFYEDHALPLARHLGDKRRELRLCHKLSELHCQLGNPHQVTMHSTDALQLSVQLGDGLSEKVTYHRLGLACVQQARFQLAEHHFLRALSLSTSCRLSHDELYYCMHGCLRLGDLASDKLRTTEDALAYYNMALLAALELGNKQLQLRLYERLASVYHNQVLDRVRSLHLYQQARALANELNVKRINLSRKPTTSMPSKQRF
ncbi:SH3 domain and tetratricopeptide repeat-containing protein 1 isoform X2 [Petromyzon marinus]|uniref:SH3 domain and tetratricopeptide repeat-containing protein 1 isoform X2 n=1 Tax=Petromyzon marinus TaxID=7757 RepID=UPI003F708B5E